MRRPLLTVLTTPIQATPRRLYQGLRRALRPIVKPGVPRPAAAPYPGHAAVVRSVVEGLRAIGADFNFNPVRTGELGRVVYAPANEALRQAARFRREGRIEGLIAGPVNALFPSEGERILLTPEIDRLIVACEWICDIYRSEAPELMSKVRVCPAGVDADYWRPTGRTPANRAVVHWKSGDEAFCDAVERMVRRCGLEPMRIRARHGEHAHYDSAAYRDRLDEARLGVFLSAFETQGLALVEAWSMDRPTLAWNPCEETEWRGHRFRSQSSCPYLTAATGRTWRTLEELESALGEALELGHPFKPRAWVLANMTDAICARALYDIVKETVSAAGAARDASR